MEKNFKFVLWVLVTFVCMNTSAQTNGYYKDVLLNGKPARLNLSTGEFIFTDSNGKDSIVNARSKKDADTSIERLNYHIVASGENLLDISKQYGLSLAKIKDENNLKTTLVRVGQKLRVRNFDKPDVNFDSDIWEVKKGHTLYYISLKTKVSVETIKRLNGLKGNTIKIGQKLYLK